MDYKILSICVLLSIYFENYLKLTTLACQMSYSGNCIEPHLRCLRAVGFCRLPRGPSNQASLRHKIHGFYHIFAFIATTTYVMLQLVYAYQEKHDMEKLSQVLFVLLCHVTCVAKQLVFILDADRIDRLIESIHDDLFNPDEASQRGVLCEAAVGAGRLLRWYAGTAVMTCVLWIVFPVVYRAQGAVVEFPFWLGFQYQRPVVFVLVVIYSFYSTNLVAVGNTTMDAFMAAIMYQCTVQLRILRMNFENLPQTARAAFKRSKLTDYDSTLYQMFVKSIVHYKKITECCELLQDIFGGALLVQFGVGGWILCMAAYKIVSLDILSIEFASTTLFMICILVELFLYCYYGNELTVASDGVVTSVYSMEWTATAPRFRRSLLILMERAQRPLRPAAGYVIPLTLETYVKILKSSYSFYAVLRQTK